MCLSQNCDMFKLFTLCILGLFVFALGENKYSKEANEGLANDVAGSSPENDAPFRIGEDQPNMDEGKKILSARKLEALRSELTLQDKREVTWKRLRADGGDKDGLKEAELRKQLLVTLDHYGLGRYRPDPAAAAAAAGAASSVNTAASTDRLFKDKLNRLWEKAERAGFSMEELKTLREEFQHHQERIQEYYELVEEHQQSRQQAEEMSNHILEDEEPPLTTYKRSKSHTDYKSRINDLHQQITAGYDQLTQASSSRTVPGREFSEPKVHGLWQLARDADFNEEELQSLKIELQHYEQRLQKLRYIQHEMMSADQRHGPAKDGPEFKTEGRKVYDRKIKDQARQVEKLQVMLEEKILNRHTEL